MIRAILQILLTLLILGLGFLVARHLIMTAPEAERKKPERPVPVVEIQQFEAQDYTVSLKSRGTIIPRTQSTLIPQVSGRIVQMGENFRDGGLIKKDELLLEIEPTDYELALTIARSELASARLTLQEERAQAKQAESDWKKLGMSGQPDALVLRKPQLAKARAMVASAEARVQQAELDLSRTRIVAPYDGQILNKQVDLGQVVSPGAQLANLYASDIAEVRLPLTDLQLGMLNLFSADREESQAASAPDVTLFSRFGNTEWQWQGKIVRTDGTFDTRSRQLSVIAQIEKPFVVTADRPALKIGQFVTAQIEGQTLKDVFILPRKLVSGDNTIMIMNSENRVERREIPVLWQTAESVITREAINATDRLISTPLPYSLNGMKVRLAEEASDPSGQQLATGAH